MSASVSPLQQFIERSRELLTVYPNGPVFQVSREELELVAALAVPVVPHPSDEDDRGLSIDMLDVDRLRDWARLLLVHGADISHWGSVPFVAGKMQIMATSLEKAIRDIGELRAASHPRAVEPDREKS